MNTTQFEIGIFETRVPIRDAEICERSVSFKCIYDHDLITFWPFNSLFGLYLTPFRCLAAVCFSMMR